MRNCAKNRGPSPTRAEADNFARNKRIERLALRRASQGGEDKWRSLVRARRVIDPRYDRYGGRRGGKQRGPGSAAADAPRRARELIHRAERLCGDSARNFALSGCLAPDSAPESWLAKEIGRPKSRVTNCLCSRQTWLPFNTAA